MPTSFTLSLEQNFADNSASSTKAIYHERVLVGRCPARTRSTTFHVCKPEAASAGVELLMMGGVSSETR
jgi:hypothetical protein